MIRIVLLVVFLFFIFAIYKGIVSFANVAKIKEFFGKDQKKSIDEVEARAKKEKEKVLRKEEDFIITQGAGYFVLWLDDSLWGPREFRITPCGDWKETFNLSQSGQIAISVDKVDKGRLILGMKGSSLIFPME